MSTHPVYDLLLREITDELERKVLTVLIEHAGERVTRPQFVFDIFGYVVSVKELANNPDDRKVRKCVERLQLRKYPIYSSSGEAGYILAINDGELDAYVAELVTRQSALKEKADALRESRYWIKFIREYKNNQPAVQKPLW